MPLLRIENTGLESGWAVWVIQETEQELAFKALEQCPEEIISQSKRLEWLAGRVLIMELVQQNQLTYSGIHKDSFGKPFLRDLSHHISLSHSYPYVAAQLDLLDSVGIDIEQPKEKLLAIASRVLSSVEQEDAAQNVTKHCVYWCAKETLYKIHGKRGLRFSNQLNIEPFELQENGRLKGVIIANDQKQNVNLLYRIEPEYVIVYTNPN